MAGLNSSNAVTNLREEQDEMSAVSRISYLFKFTQQSILVVDETSDFGAVGRQYLGELEQVNAALVSVSSKMTDIQLRCRIVEQLAPNTIFDPEKPLADTVVNLLELSSQPLTIVVENAQHLSNTMISELLNFPKQFKSLRPSSHCDLLLVGDKDAHNKCHSIENSNGFDLVSICAGSGKLYVAQKTEVAKPQTKKFSFVSVFVVLLALLIAASIFMLVQTSENKNAAYQLQNAKDSSISTSFEAREPRVQLPPKTKNDFPTSASNEDILAALVGIGAAEGRVETEISEQMTTQPIIGVETTSLKNVDTHGNVNVITKDIVEVDAQPADSEVLNSYEFLLNAESGVVIQFASLSNLKAVEQFSAGLASVIKLAWYPKLISGKKYL